ncbi:MAG: hypothetical protein ACXU86_04870 [Archangium sp.]
MIPRHVSPRLGRPVAAGLILWALGALLQPAVARADMLPPDDYVRHPAGDARLLASDEAAAIKHPVLGLQRSALPLGLGFAVDTSLLADAALTPNLGLRWALELGPNRFVVGARYSKFMGNSLISNFIASKEPAVKRFDIDFSGPSFYALYGLSLGRVLVQAELRHARYQTVTTTATGALVLNLVSHWSIVGELGTQLEGDHPLHGAAGIRYAGDNLGISLGAAYANLSEPMLPYNGGHIPFIPTFDLSWTFQ